MQSQSRPQPPCDQCHERRVRCRNTGAPACEACTVSRLECTRNLVRKKRGPKKRPSQIPNGDAATGPGNIPDEFARPSTDAKTDGTSPDHLHRGYVQFRPTDDTSGFITVNDLADFVLNQNDDMPWPGKSGNSNNVADATTSSGTPSTNAPLNITSPDTSDPGSATRYLSSTPNFSDGQQVMYRSLSNASDGPSSIDGASLAIALGLPTRFGIEIIKSVDIYFTRLYHALPLIHEPSFRRFLTRPSQLSQVQRSFVLSFCAAAILRDGCRLGGPIEESAKTLGIRFLEQCLQLRVNVEFIDEQTPLMVTTSYFIHLSYACLDKPKSSGHFLREAISFGMGLNLHNYRQPSNRHDAELIGARRTLALLSVTERAMSILIDVPAILLRNPPSLPHVYFDEEDGNTLIAFECLYGLFKLLNPDVIDYWSTGRLEGERHRESLRVILDDAQTQLAAMSFHDKPLTDVQRADILVTQQWIRLIFWQISTKLSLLSSWSENPAFSYDYPIQLGKDLCEVLDSLPEDALKAHHFSIYCKIFEVAYSLMDILTLAGRKSDGPGSQELRKLFQILSNSPVSQMGYVRILMEKNRTQEQTT